MMNALLHILINGPALLSVDADTLIKKSVDNWLSAKPRRKLTQLSKSTTFEVGKEAKVSVSEIEKEAVEMTDESVQCNDADFIENLQQELQVTRKVFNVLQDDNNDSAFQGSSDDEFSDDGYF